MDSASFCTAAVLLCIITSANADIKDIYNTKQATSDLLWTKHSTSAEEGWEEVSSFDRDYQNTIRSYQVCQVDQAENNNWIRSPYIPTGGGKIIHLDVEFSISRCSSEESGMKGAKCKETFNIFYYEADGAVASSTFPPWQENPYKKIDTVAANAVNGINKKTFSFGPLTRDGFYIAVQDQGACMSLIAIRAYYFYCHETTEKLAVFPQTISGPVPTLVAAGGVCASNAELSGSEEPKYRCSSDGQWQILTGRCQCEAGFQANFLKSECKPCSAGTYKLTSGPGACLACPANSGLPEAPSSSTSEVDKMSLPHNQCPCHPGYARTMGEPISAPCTRPPSQPQSLAITSSNATSVSLRWSHPTQMGGRNDLFYRFECKTSKISDTPRWSVCLDSVRYVAPSRGGRFYETFVTVSGLTPHMTYRLSVLAQNGASAALVSPFQASSESYITTDTIESVPSIVADVRVRDQSATSVTIDWRQPLHPNGVITGYEVEYQPHVSSVHDPRRPKANMAPIVKQTKQLFIKLDDLSVDSGYQVRVRAKTSAGYGAYNSPSTFYTTSTSAKPQTSPQSSNMVMIIGVVCGVLFVGVILFVALRYRQTGQLFCLKTSRVEKKKNNQLPTTNGSARQDQLLQERLIVDLPPPGQRIYVDYPDPQAAIAKLGCEINPKDVRIEQVIGTGEFAEVCRGKMYANNRQMDVAVKRLKQGATKKDQSNFLREASTMAQFSDPNIVQLKGVVTKHHPVMIVTEYMENRSLDHYLKLHRDELSIIQLVTMLKGIASGMRYLSSMKYVHRDLAARNILLNSDLVCKVSDFGLSRTLENDPHATYTTQGGKIAIRWTALECILFRKFTSASDVWSYGIVMWEVMSHGEKPYWDMSNDDVIKNVQKGMRLPSPTPCPKPLHDTMVECWLADVSARPTFAELVSRLDNMLRQPGQLISDHLTSSASRQDAARDIATPNIGRAVDSGEIDSVEKWLEVQRLSKYSEHFRDRGIDNLDKVSNLTINDLKAIGIDVTLHISKLENGIRTLKRHLSTCSSATPCTSARTSNASTVLHEEDEEPTMPVISQGSVLV